VMEIRPDCTMTEDVCTAYGTNTANIAEDLLGLAQSLNRTVAAGTYYLIVTGSGGTSGAYTLNVQLTTAQCGDGVINAGEACDAVPWVSGDGCGQAGAANACQLITPGNLGGGTAGSDTCPGELHLIPAGTTVLSAAQGYSTWGYKDDYVGSCLATAKGLT